MVESERGVVAIDAALSESESRALRRELEALGKPLLAVLITHPHPDHVAGITNLVAGDSPAIIATRAVLELMRRLEGRSEQWGRSTRRMVALDLPDRVAERSFQVDGALPRIDLGPGGDAEANSVWWSTPGPSAFWRPGVQQHAPTWRMVTCWPGWRISHVCNRHVRADARVSGHDRALRRTCCQAAARVLAATGSGGAGVARVGRCPMQQGRLTRRMSLRPEAKLDS